MAELETSTSRAAIACRGVSVSFGPLQAVTDASIRLDRGGIHALVGENGAGKSTLAHVLAGLRRPSQGEVWVDGAPLRTGHVSAARTLGVAIVQQYDMLPRQLTVAEALELFEPTGRGAFRRKRLNAHWQQRLELLGVRIDPDRKVGDLPVETVQAIDIARAMASQPKVLILDEPTSLLALQARDRLFAGLRSIAAAGVTVILVLHKLSEVYAIADTVTIMRSGSIVAGPTALANVTPHELVRAMTGRATATSSSVGQTASALDEPASARMVAEMNGRPTSAPVLQLHKVSLPPSKSEPGLTDVTMQVCTGEVVGIAAVSGNGERLVVETAVGLATPSAGEVYFARESAARMSVADRRRMGMGVLPIDRNREAVSRTSSLWQNVAINELVARQRSSMSPISIRRLRERATEVLREWNVKFSNVGQTAATLSGGNAQRLVLAREIRPGLKLLVAANPTTGLDLASTDAVRTTISALRTRGVGVLLVTQDLDELLALSDRVVVLHRGCVAGEFCRPFDIEAIASKMLGAAA